MNDKGGRKKMGVTKPIRPTKIEFDNETEFQRFINYASDKKKNEKLNKIRDKFKQHKPAKKGK
ncbi:MAG: hypothetical protein H0Z33_11160 [Bacillaceae bacterium]|nr:hypothetical protein [Bacillaceae bacterium]